MTDIYENNNEDDIDYSIMQFTPLPHAVGKIWLDSDSEDGEDESGPVIESWTKNDEDEDDVKQMPVVNFEEIEEIEEKEKEENSYEYKQQHLYHPPTQAEIIKKYYSRNNKNTENDNNNNSDEYDESNFDDVNEFAILAENEEPSIDDGITSIVLGQKQQPQQKQEEEIPKQNEIENIHKITIEKPLKKEDHGISIVKKNGYQNELRELKINLKDSEKSQCN